MRFLEDGPSIPDELLNARDEGRVVFFCGAGVSYQYAKLPDFFGLAEKVIAELRAGDDCAAARVLKKARELGDELRVPGLISADRIFGLLERQYYVTEIQAAVAKCLAPKTDPPDFRAHQILLRLAKTPESIVRLVTTNFDLFFKDCDSDLQIYLPPRLPYLSKYDDFNGIVYLHGHVNDRYTAAADPGFVLSSAEFGNAYLSEDWATQFFREIVRRYIVVFVGYSADDPPIYYLLEGFRRTKDAEGPSRQIYAFHRGKVDEAVAQWEPKGVEAIAYGELNGHDDLWNTLDAWAARADNPDAWRSQVITKSLDGPQVMKPHERGQVAHIVSSYQGAKEFAERKPPAEWLCVFDPKQRFARADKVRRFEPDAEIVDPFDLYRLDSDIVPERADPEKREVAPGAWDAFSTNELDIQDLTERSLSNFRGPGATSVARLPRRLGCISNWIMNVANQPAALWWAVRQDHLHPNVQRGIAWQLESAAEGFCPDLRKAWRYLLECWESASKRSDQDWYDLKDTIERDGWDSAAIREFAEISHPYLRVKPSHITEPIPPAANEDVDVICLVRMEMEWPDLPSTPEIPGEWLTRVIQALRHNMESAVRLSEEIGDWAPSHLVPVNPDGSPDISDFQRTRDVSGYVLGFVALFERLLELDFQAAEREVASWIVDDQSVFARLRIWVGGKPQLTSPEAFIRMLEGLDNEAFWSSYHQRDLLITLQSRWADLSVDSRRQIESRILMGRDKWEGESDESHQESKAWHILNRLQWLINQGCELTFDPAPKIAALSKLAPNWKPEYAVHATDSRESRGGFVSTDLEHEVLLREPIGSILEKAREISGRDSTNRLREYDPFAGLCEKRPRRAYLALARAARKGEYPKWAWKKFLQSSARKEDKPSFSARIAARLCKIPNQAIATFLYSCTYWLHNVHKSLSAEQPDAFDRVTSRLIDLVAREPSDARSALLSSGTGRDWSTAALNSPAGHIALVFLGDARIEGTGKASITPEWLARLERLLALRGDPRRHAINMLSHQFGWFYSHAPEWTEQHLLSILDTDDENDKAAFWAGFLWSPHFIVRLKAHILALAGDPTSSRRGHIQSLAKIILEGWVWQDLENNERLLSDIEFQDALFNGGNEFRSNVIWQIERVLVDQEHRAKWEAEAVELFSSVWPRQKVVKNAEMSFRLVQLLISNADTFPRLVDSVLPLLTTIDQAQSLYLRQDEITTIVNNHPGQLLSVFTVILPDEVTNWPYGIGGVLERIGEADADVRESPQYRELMRKWNSR